MRKLDKFIGRITSKDPRAKIQKTLTDLENYLRQYEENEAAEIVEFFRESGSQGLSEQEINQQKEQRARVEKGFKNHTHTLEKLYKKIAKIQEDLIDEQNTATKAGKANWVTKSKEKIKRVKESKSLEKLKKSPLQWLKEALFGGMLGQLAKALLAKMSLPLIAAATAILGGALAVGKWGFKLIAKTVTKLVTSALGKATDFLKLQARKTWDSFIQPKVSKVLDKIKPKNKRGSRPPGSNQLPESRAMRSVGKFFESLSGQVQRAKSFGSQTLSKAKTSITNNITKAKDFAKSLGTKDPGFTKASKGWSSLKDRVLSIGNKILNRFKKTGAKGKVASKLASKLPKAMGKFASKFVPGIGLALLAYDAYAAAKKSDSIVSFAVNLIDQVSGGLLGLGLGQENLGEYVSNLLSGSGQALAAAAGLTGMANIPVTNSAGNPSTQGLNLAKLEANGVPILRNMEMQNLSSTPGTPGSNGFNGSPGSNGFNGTPGSNGIQGIQGLSGSNGIQGLSGSNGSNGSDGFGNFFNNPSKDLNLADYDVRQAQQIQSSLLTLEASMKSSAWLAASIAGNSANQVINTIQPSFFGGSSRDPQTIVQG